MHLGLIDGPFVPHNKIPAQESPIPLPKFQMAPSLKILMSSGSKKGTLIYYSFLSRVPASESPPGSPTGPLWKEMPVSWAFLDISSRVPSKGALPRGLSLFREKLSIPRAPSSILKSLVDEPPSRFPSGASMERDTHRQSLFYLSSRAHSKGALPPGSLHRAPIERERRSTLRAPFKGHPLCRLPEVSGTRWRWGMLC